MKVRVTEGTLQESCRELETAEQSVEQPRLQENINLQEKDINLLEKENMDLLEKEENPDLLDEDMEQVLREVYRVNRVDCAVCLLGGRQP